MSHFYYAFGAGITSELMLRGAFQIFTVKDQKGERPFMFGLQRLVQALENYTCDRAATRDAHNKNKFIDKHIPDISFPQFMTSVEVIVPSPWFPEAVEMLKEHPDLDVGIHLALSSEWDNVKWGPVSDAQSIRDENGYFFPMILRSKK